MSLEKEYSFISRALCRENKDGKSSLYVASFPGLTFSCCCHGSSMKDIVEAAKKEMGVQLRKSKAWLGCYKTGNEK